MIGMVLSVDDWAEIRRAGVRRERSVTAPGGHRPRRAALEVVKKVPNQSAPGMALPLTASLTLSESELMIAAQPFVGCSSSQC
jgi:hypothetical protein